jgi:hypothetical protein
MAISVSGLAAAAPPPTFADFPVKTIFKGKPAAPNLSTPDARRFRTELRRQAASGPDFAGHFALALWGCGAGCVSVAVIDSMTGDVYFAPFTFQDGRRMLEGERGLLTCHHASSFNLESELFIVEGDIADKVGTHYYRWHDKQFTLVYYDPVCSVF